MARLTKKAVTYSDVAEQATSETNIDPKTALAIKERNQQLKDKAAQATPDKVVNQISNLSLEIGRNLSAVSEQFTTKLAELEEISQAVEIEKRELERVHGSAVVAKETLALVHEHEQIREQW